MRQRPHRPAMLLAVLATLSACSDAKQEADRSSETHIACANLPRAANAALESLSSPGDWYQVYLAGPGVYALVEPYQFQEAISYLIVGQSKALLFDSGIGLVPIRPVVEKLTALPVEVLNSHTHFDHVGGNYEFDTVLALDTDYTRSNMAGFTHDELLGEVVDVAFCNGAPAGVDVSQYFTRAWSAKEFVDDGDVLDLGDRSIEVLHVPGHTPDSIALLDRAHDLMWTGDSYYDGGLWLFVPETDLDAYVRSMERLAEIALDVRYLLPAHNGARAASSKIRSALDAVMKMRSGSVKGEVDDGGRLVFEIDDITILTARPLLDGVSFDESQGGSGLADWPSN